MRGNLYTGTQRTSMLNWISWALGVYFFIAILFFARVFYISNRMIKTWKKEGFNFPILNLLTRMISDCLFWPVYILWHGFKNIIEDLR